MSKTIDYTNGNRWGHSLLFMTDVKGPPHSRIKDWMQDAARYDVLCICARRPEVGDTLQWRTKDGIVRAPIYAVKPKGDPRDMFNLFVRVTPDCREDAA